MTSLNKRNPESEWFGDKPVTPREKTSLVVDVFDSVADRYDLMNDLMSAGIHRIWKDQFVRAIRPHSNLTYLDVAGGTGDIAFRLRKKAGSGADITICDLNAEMLRVGRDRAMDRGWIDDFKWLVGNAESLPAPDNSVDVYTIAFGLRNVTRIDTALEEAFRVLKPGGRFYCLEFSRVQEPFLRWVYDIYADMVIPRLGQVVANDRESYQYLVESIRKFPRPTDLVDRMSKAGFSGARFTPLTFGVACVHQGWKA